MGVVCDTGTHTTLSATVAALCATLSHFPATLGSVSATLNHFCATLFICATLPAFCATLSQFPATFGSISATLYVFHIDTCMPALFIPHFELLSFTLQRENSSTGDKSL